jgi:putative transposase
MTLTHSGASELSQLMEGTTAGALIPEIVRRGFQDLLEAEVSALTGAQLHERCPDQRSTHRNGYRERLLTTQVGDLTLAIPKLRQGSFFPNWLEPRRRVDKALYAVVMEAYTGGISTRKVDALVEALGGASGISKSEVSRICQGLDEQVKAFLQRPLDHARFPYVYLDATYLHGRLGRNMQVVSRAVVVAIGINALGYREVLGIAVGDSEAEGFWRQFLGSLKERGLTGTRLVISDAHLGLTAAIKRMFQGSSWQRCRVHFLRNLLSHVPKAGQDMVAAAMKAVFVIQAPDQVRAHWQRVTEMLRKQFPTAVPVMEPPETTCWRSCTSRRSTGARSGAPTRSSGSTRRSSGARTWSASSPTTPPSPGWWAASCWSSRRNGSWSAGASSLRPPWPRSRNQKRPWSSPMVICLPSQTNPSAEPHQLLPRSTQNTLIAELPIQRSGFTMDERSCSVSFQAVIP